ncbi:hypothetical protein [Oceanobacillus neutriphilus]|uniref:Uncharacterized protein n=1 Tax=Oceanobacillus neutriphilus TaxID=531815 RepID=A0ABQ2NXY3_9BACI|nr:hypothetical protein [Oceanobacillus neutriphilus]GGP13274.1 hypothetical protein GCM10011346_32760 [Oceanobacillus neutriphilus]
MRKITISVICVTLFSLAACQQNDLFNDETLTSIEIQKWKDEAEINTIIDEALINNLIEELESANSSSTSDIDIPNPDYRLLFFNGDRIVQELGYYIEEKDFNGTTGQYIDMETGNHFGVTAELPIDGNN